MDSIFASLRIAESGMAAQSSRFKVISQNIANRDSTATVPGGDPYLRKTIFFESKFDDELGGTKVVVTKYGRDSKIPLVKRFQPYHPAADLSGYVLYPNVDSMIEIADSKEAERGYQLNLAVLSTAASMINKTLSIISSGK